MKNLEDIYPLTPMQQGILFHTLYARDPRMYFEQIRATIHADLNVEAFKASWEALVKRHAVLRSAFMWDGLEQPMQVVRSAVTLPWSELDWRGLSAEEQDRKLSLYLKEDKDKGFVLERAPLMRCALIRVDAAEYHFIWSHHHILLDGWCCSIIVKEAFDIYRGMISGREISLPRPRPYKEYIAWLLKQDMDEAKSYWAGQLSGFETPTAMRVELPSIAGVSGGDAVRMLEECREYIHILGKSDSDALRLFAREQHVTLNTVIQTAWGILLSRYSGQKDIVFGTVVSGRPANLPGVESMVGLFVNTIPVRMKFEDDCILSQRLKAEQDRYVEREQFSYSALVDIQGWSSVPRDTYLFETLLAFENYPVDRANAAGNEDISIIDAQVSLEETNYPLVLQIHPEDQIGFRMLYDPGRFSDEIVTGMTYHLKDILLNMLSRSDRPLSELSLLSDSARAEVEDKWDAVSVDKYRSNACLHHLFEQRVSETPEAIAVSCGGESLSYAQLNGKANKLAHYLSSRGVGPDILVGLCVERSVHLPVGLLAILKAGGVYVPLDPSYPRARLQLMLEDTGLKLVLTESAVANRIPFTDAELFNIDAAEGVLESCAASNPEIALDAGSLAYVIYTSGSTGMPKGSLITHSNVTRLFSATDEWFGFNCSDVWTMFHSFGFDFSVWEIWGALLYGGRLVIVPYLVSRSPDEFRELLINEKVTVLNQTPSAFYQLLAVDQQSGDRALGETLRLVVFGGEALDFNMLRPWFDRYGDEHPAMVNMYGITETTVHVTYRRLNGVDSGRRQSMIGLPIPDLRVAVLDWCGQPLPSGVPGEMYVGGAGVARGYLNRPELTRQRFVRCPLSRDDQGMVYRTGDLVRMTAGNDIEYLGRIDQQVQLRGFRVEPGEIESQLMSHPNVRECVVTVAEDPRSGMTRLLAYVVPDLSSLVDLPQAVPQVEEDADGAGLVSQWQRVFQNNYTGSESVKASDFNISGWNSSYSGTPIAADEMREWVDCTVERILALKPVRVLEIGCGTGLLLSRIAPHCEEYCGTDFSGAALDYVRLLKAQSRDLGHVKLVHSTAEDFSNLPHGDYDLVILNSVVQYFPGIDYLLTVLKGAVGMLGPGGRVFVGDVRNLSLLDAAHASFELYGTDQNCSLCDFRQKVETRIRSEEELVVDPEFFRVLTGELPLITNVQTLLKRGNHHNELTRFRYDAILYTDKEVMVPDVQWLDWKDPGMTLTAFRDQSWATGKALAGIRGIPDGRISREIAAVNAVKTDPLSKDPVSSRINMMKCAGIDPEEVWDLGRKLGCEVLIEPARTPGYFDAVFIPEAAYTKPVVTRENKDVKRAWTSYATNPQWRTRARLLSPVLRAYLQENLPSHMVPSAVIMLDHLPLGPTGKVDRKALPSHDVPETGEVIRNPCSPTEELLAGIWTDLLGSRIRDTESSFFDLGGHSLLATQVISRVRKAFGVDIPLRVIFDYPTVAGLAEQVDISRKDPGFLPPPIKREARSGSAQLSFAQQRLWFLDQLEGQSAVYNMPCILRVGGNLDLTALEKTINEIVRRHEVLRTSFQTQDDLPVQVISDSVAVQPSVIDLTDIPDDKREQAWSRLAAEEAGRPFNLAELPLLRVTVVKLDKESHIVMLIMHHIISDGWSMGIFIEEFAVIYKAFCAPERDIEALPELQVQYADFAIWQRKWLRDNVLEQQLEYWQRHLEGAPAVLNLPVDRPRPTSMTFRGKLKAFEVDSGLTEALGNLSNKCGVTMFMTLLTGYALLLSRYSAAKDLVIGTPIAGRNFQEIESLIGFFVNTLALRVDLSGNLSVQKLLQKVRRIALDAYTHQDLPFELLVDKLRLPRDPGHAPLFQVMFVMQNNPEHHVEIPGLAVTALHAEQMTTKFDITMSMEENNASLSGEIEFNADLFDDRTIDRLIKHYKQILAAMVRNPRLPSGYLDIMDEDEKRSVICSSGGEVNPLSGECVHQLFEERAAERPDAAAIVSDTESITYGALNRRANQLARFLQSRGLGRECLAGICMEKSPDVVVCMLAILKAGGAYVPLDPFYPRDRLDYLINDSGVKLVIGSRTALRKTGDMSCELICIEDIGSQLEGLDGGNPGLFAAPEHLAYVIYTSGSTGLPKGVMLHHGGLHNLVKSQGRVFGVGRESRFLQFASISFDVATSDIFTALCNGASLCMPDPSRLLPGRDLVDLMRSCKISHIELPASILSVISPEDLPELSTVIVGGEVADEAALKRWSRCCDIFNAYGPTEVTVCATTSRYEPGMKPNVIGRPLDNVSVYILDEYMQPVPVGVAGELCVGGAGVARGYLNQAGLTAQQFVPDLYGDTAGGRLYRTGDIARYLPDGNLEFAGRKDTQIKIRGFRVEPGEIENVLRVHPLIRQAAVVLREPGGNSTNGWLAAFVSSEDDRLEVPEIREYLAKTLPDYMVPEEIVPLQELPLTNNGKIDKEALMLIKMAFSKNDQSIVKPVSDLEKRIHSVWMHLLGHDGFGVHESFFEVGGHSLSATQLVSRLRDELKVEISLRSLFANPSVAEVARLVEQAAGGIAAKGEAGSGRIERSSRRRKTKSPEIL